MLQQMLAPPDIQTLYKNAPAITDWARNPTLAEHPLLALLLWASTFTLIALIFRPLMPAWTKKSPDGGWLISKLCGWIIWALSGWWVATLHITSNRLPLYLATLALITLAAFWAHKQNPHPWTKQTLLHALGWETLWLLTFTSAVIIRLLNPDLWHPIYGGEKFMELSMMHAVVRTPYFPPLDPYFAGASVNYYYWGYQLFTPLIKLLGLPPTSAFNLAQPTTIAFSLTLTAQALTHLLQQTHLNRRLLIGSLIAGIWIMLAGNPASIWPWDTYWDASRRIAFTINEFPAWTFLFADLHPHSFNFIFGPAYLLTLIAANPSIQKAKNRTQLIAALLPSALLLSTLACCNTWDAPAYLLLTLALLLTQKPTLLRWLPALPIALLLHLPFYLNYQPIGVSGLGLHKADTNLLEWLSMWGIHLTLGLLIPLLAQPRLRTTSTGLITFAITLPITFFFALIGQPVTALLLLPLTLLIYQTIILKQPTLPLLIQGLGWCILLGVEWIYIKDFYDGGDYYRMNTVFKFGLQAWILLGLGLSLHLLQTIQQHNLRRALLPILLMLTGSLFLPWALPQRIAQRMDNPHPPQGTLDGTAFMTQGNFAWPNHLPPWDLAGEKKALDWLRTQAADHPRIILEAPLGYYREMGCRTASLTGHLLPIGMHQYAEQRPPTQALPRQRAINQLWITHEPSALLAQIDALHLDYIYLGQLEKNTTAPATLRALKTLQHNNHLNIAYQNNAVTIYQRPHHAH